MRSCAFCNANALFRDREEGQYLCLEHARFEVRASASSQPVARVPTVRPAVASDRSRIAQLTRHFWDETVVDCFDRQYDLLSCPAFVACDEQTIVGLASYALEDAWNAVVLVVLNVLPGHQGRGAGRALLDSVRAEALRHGASRILVATTNDDLPALALYQRHGFRLGELLPGRVARHHGGEFPGFSGIPVRDEIRLTLDLGSA